MATVLWQPAATVSTLLTPSVKQKKSFDSPPLKSKSAVASAADIFRLRETDLIRLSDKAFQTDFKYTPVCVCGAEIWNQKSG